MMIPSKEANVEAVLMLDKNKALFFDTSVGVVMVTVEDECLECVDAGHCEGVRYAALPLVVV